MADARKDADGVFYIQDALALKRVAANGLDTCGNILQILFLFAGRYNNFLNTDGGSIVVLSLCLLGMTADGHRYGNRNRALDGKFVSSVAFYCMHFTPPAISCRVRATLCLFRPRESHHTMAQLSVRVYYYFLPGYNKSTP